MPGRPMLLSALAVAAVLAAVLTGLGAWPGPGGSQAGHGRVVARRHRRPFRAALDRRVRVGDAGVVADGPGRLTRLSGRLRREPAHVPRRRVADPQRRGPGAGPAHRRGPVPGAAGGHRRDRPCGRPRPGDGSRPCPPWSRTTSGSGTAPGGDCWPPPLGAGTARPPSGPGPRWRSPVPAGHVGSYLPAVSGVTPGVLARCPLTVRGSRFAAGGSQPGAARAAAVRHADTELAAITADLPAGTTLMVTAPGSTVHATAPAGRHDQRPGVPVRPARLPPRPGRPGWSCSPT